ncbi:MAG TPA: thermonuclease family protein [Gemmataceae bacterium]|jgi:endonuclease YncB( thermonuclease family)|nr:thermonuclease family protein [Gemmataceae bacterium]
MRWLTLFLLIPFSALAESYAGQARVVDGDTIYIGSARLRFLSMDAFESAQTCTRDGVEYGCGAEATRALSGLIGSNEVRCEGDKTDRYSRPLVHCWVGQIDLGREMVRLGWALAAFGNEYREIEAQARADHAGAWAGTFEDPARFRHRPR